MAERKYPKAVLIMTKEEILAKARRENKGKDIVDLEIQSKSQSIAGATAMVIGAVLNIRGSFPIFWVMFFCYSSVFGFSNMILGVKCGRNKGFVIWLIYGLIMLVMTVLAIIRLFTEVKTGKA